MLQPPASLENRCGVLLFAASIRTPDFFLHVSRKVPGILLLAGSNVQFTIVCRACRQHTPVVGVRPTTHTWAGYIVVPPPTNVLGGG